MTVTQASDADDNEDGDGSDGDNGITNLGEDPSCQVVPKEPMKTRKPTKAKDSDDLAHLMHHISENSGKAQVIESRTKALLDSTADTKTCLKVAWGTWMATMMPRIHNS